MQNTKFHRWNADRLRAMLEVQGKTEVEFATEWKVTRQASNRWVNGSAEPGIKMVLKWCNRYHLAPSFFFQEVEQPAPARRKRTKVKPKLVTA